MRQSANKIAKAAPSPHNGTRSISAPRQPHLRTTAASSHTPQQLYQSHQPLKYYHCEHKAMPALRTIQLNFKAAPLSYRAALPDCYCLMVHQHFTHFCPTVPCLDAKYRWCLSRPLLNLSQLKPIKLHIISYEDCRTLFEFEVQLGERGETDKKSTMVSTYQFEVCGSPVTLSIEYAAEIVGRSLGMQRQRMKRLGLARKRSGSMIGGEYSRQGRMLGRVCSAKMIPTREGNEGDIRCQQRCGQAWLKQYIQQAGRGGQLPI